MEQIPPTETRKAHRHASGMFLVSTAKTHAETSAFSRHGIWEIIGSVLGRGTLMSGRSPRNPRGEALVLAPPGVKIPAAADSGEQVSARDWRVALWPADEAGNLHVDIGRPSWVSEVSLAYVIGLIEVECPLHLSWVADRIERQLLNARIADIPDEDGFTFEFAEQWGLDAEAVLEELEIALAPDAQHREAADASELKRLLPDLHIPSPEDPGKFEPRLTRGWMRAFYAELADDSTPSPEAWLL